MLFPWIEKTVQNYCKEQSIDKSKLINLGIGDTCHPLPDIISKALITSIKEMTRTNIGYNNEQGLSELRCAISTNIYNNIFSSEEIFITEGIANSLSMLIRNFPKGSTIAILSPTYPVYKTLLTLLDINVIELDIQNNFSNLPEQEDIDAIIVCSPNNPTGIAFSKNELQTLVCWAKKYDTLILYDGAYESFIFDDAIPKSIYEINGAKQIAIEMRSFSKSLGFSGLRLGYFSVSKELKHKNRFLLAIYKKIIAATTNGVSYPIQQAGIAAVSNEGLKEIEKLSFNYMEMTNKLKLHLLSENQNVLGGTHAPYLFLQIDGCSKKYFKKLLTNYQIITIPGIGFGKDGFVRLSGFIQENTFQRASKALSF